MKSTNRFLFLKVLQLKVVVVMDFLMNGWYNTFFKTGNA